MVAPLMYFDTAGDFSVLRGEGIAEAVLVTASHGNDRAFSDLRDMGYGPDDPRYRTTRMLASAAGYVSGNSYKVMTCPGRVSSGQGQASAAVRARVPFNYGTSFGKLRLGWA